MSLKASEATSNATTTANSKTTVCSTAKND